MRRLLTGLLGATLVLGACGGDDGEDTSAITSIPDGTSSTTTSTTEPEVPPPDVIPSDPSLITEEYVEQVLDALYEVSLEAALLAQNEGVVDRPSIERLEATSTEDQALLRINDLIAVAGSGFAGMRPSPSPMRFDVLDVLEAKTDCIVAEVKTDASGLLVDPFEPEGARDFVRLYPATTEQLATGFNPTAWVVDQFPVTVDGSVPKLRCES